MRARREMRAGAASPRQSGGRARPPGVPRSSKSPVVSAGAAAGLRVRSREAVASAGGGGRATVSGGTDPATAVGNK